MAPLGLSRPPLPPIYPPEKPGPMDHLSCGGNRLGRYGIAAQALERTAPHALWLDHDRQRKGSLLWPAKSRAELVSASTRSSPCIFFLTFVRETAVAVPTAEHASAEIEY
jgi:hypothetical protein